MEKARGAAVDVIILNWNGGSLLRRFLPSVLANTDPELGRVVVADNGSTDESLDVLAEEFPGVEVWAFDANHGFAGGYNLALERSCAPYCVLLNSDVAPAPGWLAPLYAYMEAHPRCGACQPKLLSVNEPDRFEYAGAAGGLLDRNGYPYCRGRIFDTCEADCGQYDAEADVFWASGAAMMVRRELYLGLGGLDSAFFAHMEEIDLCWRMHSAGYTVAAVPSSEVYHLGGGSLPPSSPRKTYLNFRNNLLMLHKNLPRGRRGRIVLRRMLLDGVAAVMFLLKGQWGNVAAIWRAHGDFRRMRRAYTTQPAEDALQATPDGRRDILVDYYLRRRRTYSALR